MISNNFPVITQRIFNLIGPPHRRYKYQALSLPGENSSLHRKNNKSNEKQVKAIRNLARPTGATAESLN